MKKLTIILAVLVLAGQACATDYQYSGGYYWNGNYAYNRVLVQQPGYYYGGCYYPGSAQYQYNYSHTYQAPAQTYTAPAATDWRTELLKVASKRDAYEQKLRASMIEHQQYMEAVKALGLPQYAAPLYMPGAGAAYNLQGSLQLSTAGVNGNTVYGYSYSNLRDLYGSGDLATLYQQAARLAENSQKLSGQATGDFSALIGQEGQNRAKVAEILAKGQAIQEMLRAMEGTKGAETKTFTFKLTTGADGKVQMEKVPEPGVAPEASRKAWEQSAINNCVACHAGGKKEGKFDVTQYPAMSPEEKRGVIARLVTMDETKRMPRAEGGKAGKPLSQAELKLWLEN